jgi:excisionase family DNA binding protein
MGSIKKLRASDIIEIDEEFIERLAMKMLSIQKEKKSLKVYSVKEVAKLTKVTPQTIHSHIKFGLLKATKPGGKNYNITEEAYDDYIKYN